MRGFRKLSASTLVAVVAGVVLLAAAVAPVPAARPPGAKPQERIKSFCIDFNWVFHPQRFAPPGTFAHADPKVHYQWFKDLGVNVIQTFCVTCNGYAWYRGSAVAPVQPGMKHDFLREITELAHHDGIKVIGYFCVAPTDCGPKNTPTRATAGSPIRIHIPLTNEYLDYLTASIKDALIKTDIDGFQIDWVFSPPFLTDGKKIRWMECEQQMYGELFGQPFPGADKIDAKQATEFQRRAVARCWRRIHDAAKATRPNCIIWLISSELKSPQQAGSQMLARSIGWSTSIRTPLFSNRSAIRWGRTRSSSKASAAGKSTIPSGREQARRRRGIFRVCPRGIHRDSAAAESGGSQAGCQRRSMRATWYTCGNSFTRERQNRRQHAEWGRWRLSLSRSSRVIHYDAYWEAN